MSRQYKIRYNVERGLFLPSQVSDDQGLTDQIILCSIIDHEDGSGSYLWFSRNGHEDGEVHAAKQMNAMALFAKTLSENEKLGPGAREFCRAVFESYRQARLANRS